MVKDTLDGNHIPEAIVLNGLYQKIWNYTEHIDTQTNVIVVLSSAIFVLALPNSFREAQASWPYLILSLFSGISVLVALFSLNPPAFMRKKGQKESVFYHHRIVELPSAETYFAELWPVLKDEKRLVNEYAVEIYNLCNFFYFPKRRLFNLSRNLLVTGFGLSFGIFVIEIVGKVLHLS